MNKINMKEIKGDKKEISWGEIIQIMFLSGVVGWFWDNGDQSLVIALMFFSLLVTNLRLVKLSK